MTTLATAQEVNPALDYMSNESNVGLVSRVNPDREKTRYVFCIGDHIEPQDKINLKNAGGSVGGIWIGHSETQGAPTMQRTNYMVFRGGIIPLEITSIPKKADHREPESKDETYLSIGGQPTMTRGYTVYPGDTLQYLMNDTFHPMGVVEISPLTNIEWATGAALNLQNFFFPEWTKWASGEGKFPILTSEWEALIQAALAKAQREEHEIIGYEMLESARLFKQYASSQIEKNRQAILSSRNVDKGGFYISWTEKAKLYAKQLNETLEDTPLAQSNAQVTELASRMDADMAMRQKELEVQKEANRLMFELVSQNRGTPSGGTTEVPKIEFQEDTSEDLKNAVFTEPTTDDLAKDVSDGQVEMLDCTKTNKDGSPCKSKVLPGKFPEGEEMCPRHAALAEKETEN